MDILKEFSLTEDQLKSAKAVYKAIRKANKLGVCFWDNYGRLACYNGNKITPPVPSPNSNRGNTYSLSEYDVSYSEILPSLAFQAGNADDELYFEKL